MFVFRIAKKEYIEDLSGSGAGLYGGRWNSKGINMLYTARTIALAYLEFFVHNYHILNSARVCLAKMKIPENAPIQVVEEIDFEKNRIRNVNNNFETRNAGDDFIKSGKIYALQVPSVIVPGEFNVLLNPLHPAHKEAEIAAVVDPLEYDVRLF